MNATDHPDNECKSGIENIFWRYEYKGVSYPDNPGLEVISGQQIFERYGEAYNTSEIKNYLWPRTG